MRKTVNPAENVGFIYVLLCSILTGMKNLRVLLSEWEMYSDRKEESGGIVVRMKVVF
jgi:hypothetical protein